MKLREKPRRSRRTTRRPVRYTFYCSSSSDDAEQQNSPLVKKSGIKRKLSINRSFSHENDIKDSALSALNDALYSSETSVEPLSGKCTQTVSVLAEQPVSVL